jgi:isopenicillin N synthase-like dioxygenase
MRDTLHLREALPVVDFSGVRDGDQAALQRAAAGIADAFADAGFFYLANHGIPAGIIADAVAAAHAFFALPLERKREVELVRHRGFVALGNAHMVGARLPDYKESFVVGLELPDDDPSVRAGEPLRGPNRWPAGLPSFRTAIDAYFAAVAACGDDLLRAVAVSLGANPAFFAPLYRKPLQRTNIVYYPAHPVAADADLFGNADHTDYGTITLLWQDASGGLQIKDRASGRWIDVPPLPDTLVINAGDLLERWSNHRVASTPHRVVNRSGAERYSLATFYDPDFGAVADPRDLGTPAADSRYAPVRAGDYILGRITDAFGYRERAHSSHPANGDTPS